MLINATRPQEVRAAILKDNRLDQLEIEVRDAGLLQGNIYGGRVANVHAGLNACFVEFGVDKQGFLPFSEISPSSYHKTPKDSKQKPRIEDVIQKGREILVQVVKDSIGDKGAALTTRISLAGRYIVLMPLDESRGVSRKISSDSQRKKIKDLAASLKVPEEYGFIVRTAGMDRSKTDLNRDAARLVRTWKEVLRLHKKNKQVALLHEDRDLVVRMLRDYYSSEISQIIVDRDDAWAKANDYFKTVMPRSKRVLTKYVGRVPLFTRYGVEDQVETIFSRRVDLPSGGYILIDPTEALTAIDVNSGRSIKHKSQAETAYHTNLEAATEVSRQLRLRDVGGLIVVDFIDMAAPKHNRAVEKNVKNGFKNDKARSYVSRMSDNGLLEINRQRIKAALELQTHRNCPTCNGRGVIPGVDFVALKMLRKIEAQAASGTFAKVIVSLHPELADHLQNAHRRDLIDLEDRFAVLVSVEGRPNVRRGDETFDWQSIGELSDWEREIIEARQEILAETLKAEEKAKAERLAEGGQEQLDTTADSEEEEAELSEEEADFDRLADEDTIEAAEASSEDEQSTQGDDEAPQRKRRRRRRGRGRGRGRGGDRTNGGEAEARDAAEQNNGAAKDADSTEQDAGEAGEGSEQGASSAANGEEGEERLSRSQKRRRRRRRKRERDREEGEGNNQAEASNHNHSGNDASAENGTDQAAPASSSNTDVTAEKDVTVDEVVAVAGKSQVDDDAPAGATQEEDEAKAEGAILGTLRRLTGFGRKARVEDSTAEPEPAAQDAVASTSDAATEQDSSPAAAAKPSFSPPRHPRRYRASSDDETDKNKGKDAKEEAPGESLVPPPSGSMFGEL